MAKYTLNDDGDGSMLDVNITAGEPTEGGILVVEHVTGHDRRVYVVRKINDNGGLDVERLPIAIGTYL